MTGTTAPSPAPGGPPREPCPVLHITSKLGMASVPIAPGGTTSLEYRGSEQQVTMMNDPELDFRRLVKATAHENESIRRAAKHTLRCIEDLAAKFAATFGEAL